MRETQAPAGVVAGMSAPGIRRAPTGRQVLGEILLTLGVLVLLFACYEAFWTNLDSGRKQAQAQEHLAESWEERGNPRASLTPELGEAFARMYIPSFGSDFQFAILEGTDEQALLAGPGRYEQTQLPGEPGNFAVAGHRVGKGAPFNDLGNLKVCDAIVVGTRNSWDTYRVLPIDRTGAGRREAAAECFTPEQVEQLTTGPYAAVQGRHITLPGDVGVLDPVPGQAIELSGGLAGVMTLTTCHPRFSNAERMIVHGMLVESTPKDGTGQRPTALEES